MVISTRRQVWFFSMTVTAIALAVAEMMNFVLFPGDVLPYTVPGTAIIVFLITIPITLWVGEKMRENAMLTEQLQRTVNRDRLTNVGTRDFFFARMGHGNDPTGTMLMVDVDHFKIINDTYGHLVGDDVIGSIAAILKRHVRQGDLICRFGGEEFVIFLPDTALADGFEMAERLRQAVEEAVMPHVTQDRPVTVSIGGALKHRAIDVKTALQQADKALYRAKGQGRNRTIFAATPRLSPPSAA